MLMLIPLFIISLIFGYLEYSVGFAFPKDSFSFWIFAALVAVPYTAQLWMVLVYFKSKEEDVLLLEDFFKTLAYFGMGFSSFLLVLTLLRDLAGLILKWTSTEPPEWLHSPFASVGLLGLTAMLLAIGYFQARFVIQTPRVEVAIANLPAEFENFKIVQLSDVHFGTGPKLPQVQRIMNRTLSLNADLIALTGDIIDGAVPLIQEELKELSRLKAPHGVYFVMGNHEYYWTGKDALTAIQKTGVTTLQNKSVIIQ
jgi:hypothetical protein